MFGNLHGNRVEVLPSWPLSPSFTLLSRPDALAALTETRVAEGAPWLLPFRHGPADGPGSGSSFNPGEAGTTGPSDAGEPVSPLTADRFPEDTCSLQSARRGCWG